MKERLSCGQVFQTEKGPMTVKQMAEYLGCSIHTVYGRIYSGANLLKPISTVKSKAAKRNYAEPELPSDLTDCYLEGVAAHPDRSCPYKKIAAPESCSDRSQSPMAKWASWWAGWHDADLELQESH